MAFDSTAELLFHIGADSDDAEENIQRFRSLLGKDLDDIRSEFHDWAEEVFGEMNTVKGALLGLTAAAGAGVVALGASCWRQPKNTTSTWVRSPKPPR